MEDHSATQPAWHNTVQLGSEWEWRGNKLWHKAAFKAHPQRRNNSRLQASFVGVVYANQNRCRAVRHSLSKLLRHLPPDAIVVNIGAGTTRLPGVVNLEIANGENIDIIGYSSVLPFKNESVDAVITQEVLEHVGDFLDLIAEIHRILKVGGQFFCQVPFQIGFHPRPSDYWRFSRQALEHLFCPPSWKMEELCITLGHGSGFYRISVEFIAVTASCAFRQLYRPVKAASALMLYPLKWFDLLTPFSAEKDRIPGGYLCVARKTSPKL